jgi:hypothetical protein
MEPVISCANAVALRVSRMAPVSDRSRSALVKCFMGVSSRLFFELEAEVVCLPDGETTYTPAHASETRNIVPTNLSCETSGLSVVIVA